MWDSAPPEMEPVVVRSVTGKQEEELVMAERVDAINSQRWERALTRAINDGLDVLVCAATGEAFVESASRPGTLYAVSAEGCSCTAGAHGQVCKHRAAYLAQIGELALPEPEACSDCSACGLQDFGRYALPCESCGGSGVRVDRRLTGQPSVEVVATIAA
jgi:hypothetical protein